MIYFHLTSLSYQNFHASLFVQTFANVAFETRSGPLEDLRRLGKLFSEEYAPDLDKVGSKKYISMDSLDMFQWIALQLVEEDKERVKVLKEDLLEEESYRNKVSDCVSE